MTNRYEKKVYSQKMFFELTTCEKYISPAKKAIAYCFLWDVKFCLLNIK